MKRSRPTTSAFAPDYAGHTVAAVNAVPGATESRETERSVTGVARLHPGYGLYELIREEEQARQKAKEAGWELKRADADERG